MQSKLRARRVLPAAAFVLLMVASAALAQGPLTPTLTMAADRSAFTLDPGASATSVITVNSNCAPQCANVALAISGLSGGWTADVAPTSVAVGQGQTATLTVRAPAARPTTNDGTTPPFTLTVTGTVTNPAGAATTANVAFNTAMTAAPVPPPPPPEFPWALVLGALGLLAVAGLVAWMMHRRETGIEVLVPATESEARPGYDAFVPIEIKNTSSRPRVASIAASEAPEGWAVGTNLTTLPLKPGQAESLWLAVRPPLGAAPGTTMLAVTAKPVEAKRAPVSKAVAIRVVSGIQVPAQAGRDLVAPTYYRGDRLPDAPSAEPKRPGA